MAYILRMKKTTPCYALILWLFAISAAHSAPVWVSDQFEITLRTGPTTSHSIQMMVASGTQLEVLEQDADSGYARVRTSAGTEGWVLSRYLMNEPSARERIEKLTGQLTRTNTEGTSLGSQLAAIRKEYNTARRQISTLENEKSVLESELAEIRRAAADVLGVNQQNKNLMDQLAAEKFRADTLEQENQQLASQTTRYWFMSGAAVLLVGILLGIWLPRIRGRRRSGYDFH